MEALSHHFAEVNGIKIHYVRQGQGHPVIFLHGFPEFWYSWRRQIDFFANEYLVIAPDLRGYNLSDKPQGVEAYSLSAITGDILALMDHLGLEKAHIVAHDWGGGVAWTLAYQHAQRVDRLVVLNSPHPRTFVRHLRSNFRQILRSWYYYFVQIPWLPDTLIRLGLPIFLRNSLQGWAHSKSAFSDEEVEQYVQAFRHPGTITATLNYYRAAFRNQRSAVAKFGKKSTPVPTLLIWGKDDKALGIELSQDLERYFEGDFKVEYIEDCSHWVQHDHPERVNALIAAHLKGA